MPTVNMIQKEQAMVGHEFIFNGPASVCEDCRVKAACLNLTDGKRYRVTRLRDVSHDCPLSEGLVRVVEVEASAPSTSVEANTAREGATISYRASACGNLFCDNFIICRPRGLTDGTKVRIIEVGERVECPLGLGLFTVKVAYADD